jgi:hypothetical protein
MHEHVKRLAAACGVAGFAIVATSCGGSTTQTVTAPSTESRCTSTLAVPGPLTAAGGQMPAQLATARDCVWTARSTASWLSVEPASGQGDATLTLAAPLNPAGRSRSGTIEINAQPFTVTQSPSPCDFSLSPTAATAQHQGGRILIRLTTLDGCSWTSSSSDRWLRVVSGSGGESSATLEVAVDSNTGAERSGVITIASLLFVVSQAAGPNDRSECRFSLEPGGVTIPAAGGTGSFRLSTMAACAWGALSNQPWIVLSSQNGAGSSEVSYRVEPNPSPASRSGTITVGTRRHVVQQLGNRP